jgi:hypothetical protein
MPDRRALDTLTAADFRACKDTGFRVTGRSPAPVEATLVEVTELAAGGNGAFRGPFSVLFHGPLEPVLPQGIYLVEHDRLGRLELFLVPVGPDDTPAAGQAAATVMRYEAVFG